MEIEGKNPRDQVEQSLLDADQEGKFDYIKGIAPKTSDLVSGLQQALQEKPGDIHSTFWLLYIIQYNKLVKSVRQDLEENNTPVEIHEDQVRDAMGEYVKSIIETTKDQHIFEQEDPEANSLLRFLREVNDRGDEKIRLYEPTIFEIPERISNITKPKAPTPTP